MLICVDTMVLIWGVQGAAGDRELAMPERTSRYLAYLSDERARIMVPTPAVAEYLSGFSPESTRKELQALSKYFEMPAFDLPSAAMAAKLTQQLRLGEVAREGGVARQAVKTDIQIVATAIVHGAERIVTDEVAVFTRIAQGLIKVHGVPDVAEQGKLDI